MKNIKLNNLTNVKVVSNPLSNSSTIKNFYSEANSGGEHSLVKSKFHTHTISTSTLTIDALVAHFKLSRVDLIKIDAEGAERDIIHGAIKTIAKYKPTLLLECFSNKKLKAIKRICAQYNYIWSNLHEGNNYYGKTKYPPWKKQPFI